ncbi:DMT family transporter [Pseudaeromonas paramecii]|uniref:DMT family transporter n=1 Tax=Pseudaeromonas paramecii TaxID=2138166 RepID=A0ABP8QJX1_9GAMM
MATNPPKAWAYALATVALWSTVASAFKLSLGYFSPLQLLLVASLTSCLLLAGLLSLQGKWPLVRQLLRHRGRLFLLLGLLNPLAYYLLLFQAYALLPAQQAQAINYTWAIALSLLAVPVLGQKLNRFDGLAIVCTYLGALVIATRGQLTSLQFDSPLGVGLALLSTLIWAGYWLVNAKHQADPLVSLFLGFALSLPFTLLICLVWDAPPPLVWQGWAGALYVGLFEMGLAFVFWLQALRHARQASQLSNLVFLSPFASLLWLRWLVGEAIHPATPLGLALIVAGLLIQQWPQWRKQKSAP